MLRGPSLCAATLVLTVSGAASADPPADACTAAYEGAQQLMRTGALLRSEGELRACELACPKALARDCKGWHSEVEREIPSLQVSVKTADGSDPGKVRVSVDGAPRAEPLTGAPIAVDPGKHTLTFESATRERVEVAVDVPRGRKGYAVEVRFRASAPPPPKALAPRSSAPFVLGGLGLAALGAAAVLGIKGQVDRSYLVKTCAPNCQQADVDAIAREWTAGAILAAVGGAATVAGAIWWSVDRRASRPEPTLSLLLAPGAIGVAGRF